MKEAAFRRLQVAESEGFEPWHSAKSIPWISNIKCQLLIIYKTGATIEHDDIWRHLAITKCPVVNLGDNPVLQNVLRCTYHPPAHPRNI
jgi:hypothetical protein